MVTSIIAMRGEVLAATGRTGWRAGLIAVAALVASASSAQTPAELKTYADDKGYLNVKELTCAQLAGTYQEDADFLGVWFSGWYNGKAKKHSINVHRTREGIHEVIVYCKDNPDKKITQAVEVFLKKDQAKGQ